MNTTADDMPSLVRVMAWYQQAKFKKLIKTCTMAADDLFPFIVRSSVAEYIFDMMSQEFS